MYHGNNVSFASSKCPIELCDYDQLMVAKESVKLRLITMLARFVQCDLHWLMFLRILVKVYKSRTKIDCKTEPTDRYLLYH